MPSFANGQVIIPTSASGRAEYSEVIEIDSVSKGVIYANSLDWLNSTYKNSKSVIQSTDKEEGIILGKAVTSMLVYNNMGFKKDGGHFSYNITIYCKDNKVKISIASITYNKGEIALSSGADLSETFPHNWTGLIMNNSKNRKEWQGFQRHADSEIRLLVSSFRNTMLDVKSKSNW